MPDSCKILKNNVYAYLILLVATVVPYFYSLTGDFVFDDIPLLVTDSFYREPHSPLECWNRDFWQESLAQGLYRPFTIFSYWVNAKLTGLHSPAFRAVNLLLHLITVLIVFKLAINLKLGRAVSLLAGVLFAIHPIHTEAVIPASGRGEILCGLFIFAGLLFHMHIRKNALYSIGTAICLILACWSKEHGPALILLCLLFDFYSGRLKFSGSFFQKNSGVYLVYISALAIVAVSRYEAMGTLLPAMSRFDAYDNQLALCSFPIRILSAINIQGLALFKFIWPQTLSHDYSYAQILPLKSVFDLAGIAGAVLVLSIPLILILSFPELKMKIMFFSIAYIVCIMPAANILMVTGTIFGERLYYVPSVWLCFTSACILMRISRRINRRLFMAILIIACIALGVRTIVRSSDWHDQLSISLSGVRTSPLSAKNWNNLAVQLAQSGNCADAVLACDRAIAISPNLRRAYINRASCNIFLGNFESAEKDLRKIVSQGTGNTEVYNKLGLVLANMGKRDEALKYWKISLLIDGKQDAVKSAVEDLQKEINSGKTENDNSR